MSTPSTKKVKGALLDPAQAGERYVRTRRRLVQYFMWRGCGLPEAEDLADETISQVAMQVVNGLILRSIQGVYLSAAHRIALEGFREHGPIAVQEWRLATEPAEIPNLGSPARVSTQPNPGRTPTSDRFSQLLQTISPVFYARVFEPTLADLRQEHFATLSEGHPFKARWILLQGCGSLAAAAVCQLCYSLLSRIVALWQARSTK
jgi:hypothetical protein